MSSSICFECKTKFKQGFSCKHTNCFNPNQKLLEFCSQTCLSKHITMYHLTHNQNQTHPKNFSFALDMNVVKKSAYAVGNNNPDDYYYYRNFQIVKLGNSRQVLGKGAFGDVLLVKSKKDGNNYAMKIIEKKKIQSLNIIKEEISIHLKLNHENIVKLFSFSETTDFFYLIMEYAVKGSLYSKIKSNKGIEENECREYFIQVIQAISHLHSQGLAHRDIKPENLLIDANNKIKVCDFGGAVKIEEGEERSTFFGTYEYMAPEVIEGNQYNCSVDIWALGILLYECLHGYSPFRVNEFN